MRNWLFRGLVLVATGLFIYAWFQPLWGVDIALLGPDAVLVRPWGEEIDVGTWARQFNIPTMPAFFATVMWIYFSGCIALLFASLFMGGRLISIGRLQLSLAQLAIGIVGLAHLVFALAVPLMISMKLGQFQLSGVTTPLQGTVTYNLGTNYISTATSSLRSGYWLAWTAAVLLIGLALLRTTIIGKDMTADEN